MIVIRLLGSYRSTLGPHLREPRTPHVPPPLPLTQGGAAFSKEWELPLPLPLPPLTQGGATFSKEWEAARLVLQGGLQRRVQRARVNTIDRWMDRHT